MALLQWEEDNALGAVDQLAGGLLDDGELGVDGGEGGIPERVGLGNVWGDELVWFGEVGKEGLAELLVRGVGQVEGSGTVCVGFEGCDAIGDDGVGVEMLSVC